VATSRAGQRRDGAARAELTLEQEATMAKNRFEQVDEAQPDAITLSLEKREERFYGTVRCPAGLGGGRLAQDTVSDEMPLKEAFRSAVRLANEIKAPVVVIDPDGLWQADWGELYREE
jgi:hypothetical protein